MFCKQCGKEMKDGAAFCPACGAKATGSGEGAAKSSDAVTTTTAPSATAAPATQGLAQKWSAIDPKKRRIGIIAAVVIVVAIVAGIVAFNMVSNTVPTDKVKEGVAAAVAKESGSSAYVNESAYSLGDFKITGQATEEDPKGDFTKLYGTSTTYRVNFSGTESNDNFDKEFNGQIRYAKQGNQWTVVGNPEINVTKTTPKKGVDYITKSSSSSDSGKIVEDECGNLEENNGTYTCKASETTTYTRWFATDTLKQEVSFTFDNEKGAWKADKDISSIEPTRTTDWKIKGKTYSYSGTGSGFLVSLNEYKLEVTIDDIDKDGNVTASYSAHVANSTNSRDLSGKATGTMKYEKGSSSFSVELADKESQNNVKITCNGNGGSSSTLSGNTKQYENVISASLIYNNSEGSQVWLQAVDLKETTKS